MNTHEINRELEKITCQLIEAPLDESGYYHDPINSLIPTIYDENPQISIYRESKNLVLRFGENTSGKNDYIFIHRTSIPANRAIELIKNLIDFRRNLSRYEAYDRWINKNNLSNDVINFDLVQTFCPEKIKER